MREQVEIGFESRWMQRAKIFGIGHAPDSEEFGDIVRVVRGADQRASMSSMALLKKLETCGDWGLEIGN